MPVSEEHTPSNSVLMSPAGHNNPVISVATSTFGTVSSGINNNNLIDSVREDQHIASSNN
jgi:hypothetical protein